MRYSLVMIKDIFSKLYSHLYIVGDSAGWSIDEDAKVLKTIGIEIGLKPKIIRKMYLNLPQFVHYTSQFSLIDESIYKNRNKISVDYYHGKPDQQESFRKCFEALRKHHKEIHKVRVSTKEMETLIKSSGINPDKVIRIPIGIDLEIFKPQTEIDKNNKRKELDIPKDAFVIGSFQKDGVGWGEGNEPKLIKGPDIFLKVTEKLRKEIPSLFILLSGPSRGYVKNGLDKIGVPYKYVYLKNFEEISSLYDALDLYLITSREEGGPKACLESMASGVPLVTTSVGQCKDLVVDGENAMMSDIDDFESLYKNILKISSDPDLNRKLIDSGLKTAGENSLNSQLLIWKNFFK